MKKIIIWIGILVFALIIDSCFYIIKSSDNIESMHSAVSTSGSSTLTHAMPKESVISSVFSDDKHSHTTLVSANAKYNLTNAEMQLYNNSDTFSSAATSLYNKIEEGIYSSYKINKLGYRTVVNLNNFVTYDGIRYYRVYNYYTIPSEGTISNPEGITNPNGSPDNYAGLLSTYYICVTGQTLTVSEAKSDGTKNPLNGSLTNAQIENQIKKIAIEYTKGETTMPGVTSNVYLTSTTSVDGVTYYQTTLSCPSGKQSEMQLRGTQTQAIFFMEPNGRVWQTKDQAFLYAGYYYDGLRFDGQTYFYNAFSKNWGK